jgi:hypothetical protein
MNMGFQAPPPPHREVNSKIRKKLYAEVTATISFTTKSEEDATKLTSNFLERRGIELTEGPQYTEVKRKGPTTSQFTVTYRVHGGWRSDFVKKMESDAIDMGVEIKDLEISVSRLEIPKECPRQSCGPCEFARGERDSPLETVPKKTKRKQDEPDTLPAKKVKLPFWSRISDRRST